MHRKIQCPTCGFDALDVTTFDSAMVLSADLGFFTLRCPSCGALVSTISAIPAALEEEIQFAAIQVDARMGQEKQR